MEVVIHHILDHTETRCVGESDSALLSFVHFVLRVKYVSLIYSQAMAMSLVYFSPLAHL
jgi:hypothetical protein